MTPLRKRMIDDMKLRGYSARTCEADVTAVGQFPEHYCRANVRDALDKAGLLACVDENAWNKKWVVHSQHAGNGKQVLNYIPRYLFRMAIANSRIENFYGDQVTFRYRDNRSGILKRCRLPAQEFIRRFLQHVLPRGFPRRAPMASTAPLARPRSMTHGSCSCRRSPISRPLMSTIPYRPRQPGKPSANAKTLSVPILTAVS